MSDLAIKIKIPFVIAGKEIRATVTGSLFYLIAALYSIILSVYFFNLLRMFQSRAMMSGMQGGQAPNIIAGVFMPHAGVVHILLVLIIPAFTMRLIAEERQTRTYDLLLTSPITAAQIAIGKYLAGVGITFLFLVLSFLYPFALGMFVEFSWSHLASIFLGLFFLTSLYVAFGLFASSLTSSPLLAVVMGVIFNLFAVFVGSMATGVEHEIFSKVLHQISVTDQVSSFFNGAIQVRAVGFFISAIVFFVFLSERVVESSRWR